MIKLYSLLSEKIIKKNNINNIQIKGISSNSKKIKKDYIFTVLSGSSNNGLDYIFEAINNGATAILINNKNLQHIKKKTYYRNYNF